MKRLIPALVVGVLPTWVAAQQFSQPPKHSLKSGKRHWVIGNPCAKYGVGFGKIAGSDMCVKIGGSVSVEAGGGARR